MYVGPGDPYARDPGSYGPAFWRNRHCKTNPVDLEGSRGKVWPKRAENRPPPGPSGLLHPEVPKHRWPKEEPGLTGGPTLSHAFKCAHCCWVKKMAR